MFPRYLSLHPDDARAHMHFAIALLRVGRTEEAKQKAERAIELSPNDPLMFYNAACFYANIGDTPHAVHALKNAVERRPPGTVNPPGGLFSELPSNRAPREFGCVDIHVVLVRVLPDVLDQAPIDVLHAALAGRQG